MLSEDEVKSPEQELNSKDSVATGNAAVSETPPTPADFIIAEYSSLREEILRRTEIQHQIMLAALVAAGTFFTIGVQDDQELVLLLQPIMALFLFVGWAQHDIGILLIGQYIYAQVELSGGLQWEHHWQTSRLTKLNGAMVYLSTVGIIVGTQIVALALYMAKAGGFLGKYPAMMAVDIFFVTLTWTIIILLAVYKIKYGRMQQS